MDMFLDGYARWEVGSPHRSVILHEMFLYTAEQGQKEVEWMIHCGCWHGLLKLDLQADISAVWLVGPQTSKEEFTALYYEVYKLRRLPGSPPCGLEWMEELATKIVSSLKDHLGQKEGKPLQGVEEPGLADIQPPMSKTSRRGRRDTSAKRDLTEVREAHQRALATVAALKEKIERLSQSITQGWLDICAHSRSQDHCRRKSWEWNRRHHRVWPCPFLQIQPSPVGSRIWGGWRDWTTSPGFWPGPSARVRTRGQPFPPGVSWQLRGRWQKQVLPRIPGGRAWKMGDLASMGTWYTWLVAWASQDHWCGWPSGASLEGVGLLWASLAD